MEYFFKCYLIFILAATLSFSQNPEQSIAPPGMIFELLALNKDLPTIARPKYLSPCDIVASLDGKYLYVAEQTAKQIAVVDIANKTVIQNIKLPNEPTGIAVAPNGLLYVTCSSDLWPSGMVCEVHPVRARVLRRLPAGHGARSPVVSPVENTLFVCNVFDNDVSVIDIGGAKEIRRIKAVRQPYCAAITPDGAMLVVGNALPYQPLTDTLVIACKITLINAFSREKITDFPLPTGSHQASSHNVTGMAMSPDGKYAFVTHLIGLFEIPNTKVEGGWIHTNNCAIVDIKGRTIKNDFTFDEPLQGAGNPWGVACTPDGKILCVAHSGSNELSMVDIDKLITIADTADYSPGRVSIATPQSEKTNLLHNLSALRDVLYKITVVGKAPRAVAVVGTSGGNKAYTAGYFDDYIEMFDLYLPGDDIKTQRAGAIELGPKVKETSERKGERAFFDASLCYQKWQSCHSCHPNTRPDGLNWTLNSDWQAPKNSKSMVNSWWTPPTSWAGKRPNAYESIRAGMIYELFLTPDQIVAVCMDTFLMKLKPVPSPHLVKGRLAASALRGRDIFNGSKAACLSCHTGPLFTDKKFHNAGIADKYDATINWDTPSLNECWRTAPYGHLGSKLTIQEMIDLPGMGAASAKLTQDEISDLVEFVLSL